MAEANPVEGPEEKTDASGDSSTSNDAVLQQMCSNYAEYMKLDIKKETADFEDSIEEMLTRLDEFCGLVDMIRSDTNLCLGRTLPSIHTKCLQMQNMFEKIEQLEVFVRVVAEDVALMERHVEEAEAEMGTLSGIKRVFKSFSIPPFLSKKPPENPRASTSSKRKFIPPEIFRTDMYLCSDSFTSTSSAERHVTSSQGTRLSASGGSSEKQEGDTSLSSNENSQSESRVSGDGTSSRGSDSFRTSSEDRKEPSQTGGSQTDNATSVPSNVVHSEVKLPNNPDSRMDLVTGNGTVAKGNVEGNINTPIVVQDNQTDNQNNNEVIS